MKNWQGLINRQESKLNPRQQKLFLSQYDGYVLYAQVINEFESLIVALIDRKLSFILCSWNGKDWIFTFDETIFMNELVEFSSDSSSFLPDNFLRS